jgi:glutamine synthetase
VTTRVLTERPEATRLEFRLPGADVNPYLAVAGLLASVRDGITARADLGPPYAGDAYATAEAALPTTLHDAAEAFIRSPFATEVFGKDVIRHYHAVAEFEWESFKTSVTDWERERYLAGI